MSGDYSLDSQPYAVLDDPRRLQVVSLPGRQALLQRITVDVGTGGATPPDRLRVLVRAEQDTLPVSALRIRVTDVDGVDLVEPQDVLPSVLTRARQWQFVEVPLLPTVGFGSSADKEVLVWFTVGERGPGWEIASPSTGENVPAWRGPIDGVDPDRPVFGRLLTFPAGAPVLVRVSGATLEPDTQIPFAGDVAGGDPVFMSSYFGLFTFTPRFRNPVIGSVTSGSRDAAIDGSHAYFVGSGAGNIAVIRKYLRDPFQWVSTTTMASGETSGRALTTAAGFGYIGTLTSPGRIVKVNLAGNMSRDTARTLNTGENLVSAITNDGTHLYATTFTSPGRVVKVRMSDMVRVAGVTLAAGVNLAEGIAITPDGSKLFVTTSTNPVQLVELDTATLTPTYHGSPPGFAGAGGNGSKVAVSADGTFGVLVTFGGFVQRFTVPTFGWDGNDFGPFPLRDVKIDSDSRFVYAVSDTSPARVRRYQYLTSPAPRMALAGERELPSGSDLGWGLALDDVHAFVALDGATAPRVARVTTANTTVSAVDGVSLANSPLLEIPLYDSPASAFGVHVDGTDVFTVSFQRVVKYRSTDGVRLARTDLTPAGFYGAMSSDATHVYVAGGLTVAKLAKVDLSSSTLTLNAGESISAVGKPVADDGTHLFYGTATSPGRVVKVAMSSLTRVAALTLNSSENSVGAVAIDGSDVYACTNDSPTKVVKIDGATMTRIAAITLAQGENAARSAVVQNNNLYVLTDGDPARVVEIDLVSFTRTTAVTSNAGEGPGWALVGDGNRLWVSASSEPARVIRLGESLQATGAAHALQINTQEDAAAGLDYARNFREDADVVTQFGQRPEPPTNVTVAARRVDSAGCLTVVDIGWELPDDECATVSDGGYVEVQRQAGGDWVSAFRVFGDVTRTVTDVEVARNRENVYRLRIVNDAGFVSDWTGFQPVMVVSDCCGYVFASNRFPDRAVWYDDLGDRSYRFVEQVEFVEFEGRDGSVPLRADADRLDEFDATVMVAGFGVFGGTQDAATLAVEGRTVFRPLTVLTGNKRDDTGGLLRAGHIAVADNNGQVWFATVETPQGDVVATAERYTLRVRVKETTRHPAPVELRPAVTAPTGGVTDLPFSDPNNLLGS